MEKRAASEPGRNEVLGNRRAEFNGVLEVKGPKYRAAFSVTAAWLHPLADPQNVERRPGVRAQPRRLASSASHACTSSIGNGVRT